MKAAYFFFSLLTAVLEANACPYLGHANGDENPHEMTTEHELAELQYGHLRRLRTPPPERVKPTSRPTPSPKEGPDRFDGSVQAGIASARADIIAMMDAEPSLPVSSKNEKEKKIFRCLTFFGICQ